MRPFHLTGEAAQEAFGERLSAALPGGAMVVFLEGNLGAGKTTLVRGILRGFGYRGRVKSPTYTLVEPYEIGDRRCAHLDLYRLGDPGELEYLGLRDLLGEEQLILVEWPDKGVGVLPAPDLRVIIAISGESRDLCLEAGTSRGRAVIGKLRDSS
jgi:tRNA threonylcarbamoyladenosine biosynthesis protein TsaE